MPMLAESDLNKIAERVVENFLTRKAGLDESAANEAQSGQLNADQIERLVELVNTQAFLKTMDQRKQEGAGDLMHEFDPVNAARVIKIVIDGSGARVESDSDSADSECDVPNEMADVRRPKEEETPEDVEPKVKAPKKNKTASALQLDNEKVANRRRKVSALLENQALELEQSFDTKLASLAIRFRQAQGPSYAEFEYDVCSEPSYNSKEASAVLTALRTVLKLGPLDEQMLNEKRASLSNHIYDDSPELAEFNTLLAIVKEAQKTADAIAHVRT